MELILKEDVPDLGGIGDTVKVKPGYGRNYLLPKGLAILASRANKKALDQLLKRLALKKKLRLSEAKKLADQIEKVSVTVSKQVGEGEKIFGSVTTSELEELLSKEGLSIDRRQIEVSEPIKSVGVFSANVKVHPEVTASFKVWVVAQEE